MKIDLKELSTRESERVEWKENVADLSDVVRTIAAFSNDISNLGGGYVVCGAKEIRDDHGFQQVQLVGLTSSRLKEVEGGVLAHCREKISPPVVPITDEIPMEDGRRILVFLVPGTGYAHEYRSSGEEGGKYYIRIGRETREARNGLLTELLVRKRAIEPWDRRVNPNAGIADIDLIALREGLRQMGLWDPQRPLEDYLSDKEQLSNFVPPMMGAVGIEKSLHPRNFSLLFFGANPLRLFPGAHAIFSIYRGKDRSEPTSERVEVVGTLAEQAKKLIELLNIEAYVAFDKTEEQPNQVKYPRRALHEAIVNALAHRDYEMDQPIRVTVFSDRIEITSPGSLPRGVDPEKFRHGKATAHWRNQALAYFLSKLQLAQAEGQGIPTIIRVMQEEGCPPPTFDVTNESVTCILPAHPRHALMRELSAIENKIILGNLDEATERLESMLKDDPYNFRCVELFCEVNNLRGTPARVMDLLQRGEIDWARINSATLLVLAETIGPVDDPEARNLAQQMMTRALSDKLEESEVKRVALNYRRMKDDEKAVDLIENVCARNPALNNSSALRSIAARGRIDLAKKCMDAGRNRDHTPERRGKAWDLCREYLNRAEDDIRVALDNVMNEIDRDYIQRDLDFLHQMQEIARKPAGRKATANRSRKPGSRKPGRSR